MPHVTDIFLSHSLSFLLPPKYNHAVALSFGSAPFTLSVSLFLLLSLALQLPLFYSPFMSRFLARSLRLFSKLSLFWSFARLLARSGCLSFSCVSSFLFDLLARSFSVTLSFSVTSLLHPTPYDLSLIFFLAPLFVCSAFLTLIRSIPLSCFLSFSRCSCLLACSLLPPPIPHSLPLYSVARSLSVFLSFSLPSNPLPYSLSWSLSCSP